MKKLCVLIIIVFWATAVQSQVHLTQYFHDGTLYNPALAGSGENFCANVYGRQQWLGVNDEIGNYISPKSLVFNFQAPVYILHGGIGVNVVYTTIGLETNLDFKVNYNYRFISSDKKRSLGFGIGVSLLSKTWDYSKIIIEQTGEQPETKKSATIFPEIDLGIEYQQNNKFYVGLSATNLLGKTTEIINIKYAQQSNMFLTAGYYFNLSFQQGKPLFLIPSILVRSDFHNMQIDLNARVEYNNLLWAGLSYRYKDAIAVMAGVNIKQMRFGISYDFSTTYAENGSRGGIELFLGYSLNVKPKVILGKLFNTRYL